MSTQLSAPHQSRKKRELARALEPLRFRNGAPEGIRTPDQVVIVMRLLKWPVCGIHRI